jgi:hypothetical protein
VPFDIIQGYMLHWNIAKAAKVWERFGFEAVSISEQGVVCFFFPKIPLFYIMCSILSELLVRGSLQLYLSWRRWEFSTDFHPENYQIMPPSNLKFSV